MRVGILYSRVRAEEKLLVQEFEARGVDFTLIDVRDLVFRLEDGDRWRQYDVVLERCVSHSQALASLQMLDSWGVACVNTIQVAQVCGDKLATSLALERAG
ncbi:MAG: 30S ribosomal protein S6--L-glutamate ligase, partial [Verrucomicrobiae bacterium]|nr:30S ribosomal protein S6--L-glutamate ligase [Verrucomicrobiae bacterium]